MSKDIEISKLRMEIVSGNERDVARKNAKDKEESLHQTIVRLAVIMVTIATLIVFAVTAARTTSDAVKEVNSIADQEFNRAVQEIREKNPLSGIIKEILHDNGTESSNR